MKFLAQHCPLPQDPQDLYRLLWVHVQILTLENFVTRIVTRPNQISNTRRKAIAKGFGKAKWFLRVKCGPKMVRGSAPPLNFIVLPRRRNKGSRDTLDFENRVVKAPADAFDWFKH